MRVIVEHDEDVTSYLGQHGMYRAPLSKNHTLLDIEEKYLPWLAGVTCYVEPNFSIKLGGKQEALDCSILRAHTMILAVIGAKISGNLANVYYNMQTQAIKYTCRQSDTPHYEVVNCYTENNHTDAISYIKCIQYLTDLSIELNKPLIIYADVEMPCSAYRYRTLAHKIINQYLLKANGVLITKSRREDIYKYYNPVQKPYEFYLDHTIYIQESLNGSVQKALPLLYTSKDPTRFKEIYRRYRQNQTLYEDVFYKNIPPDVEIYVMLGSGDIKPPEYYQTLGLNAVILFGNYSMLYAEKRKFDALSELLKPDVVPQYQMSILTPEQYIQSDNVRDPAFSLVPKNLKYKGKGVYIGIVTTDDVDYTNETLRTQGEATRIGLIWHQNKADDGMFYYKNQIDEALASPNPGELISLPEHDGISTAMLGIAGGLSRDGRYSGVATEAEFIVAKINSAPRALQSIYGGMPSEKGVVLPDIMIGVLKLIAFAVSQDKPLVLCIPFNTNIDSHDGTLILQKILAITARRTYLTVVLPAGEEADKMHHYGVEGQQQADSSLIIRVSRENQNVVGVIYQRFSNVMRMNLCAPGSSEVQFINLKQEGVYTFRESTIYSNGEKIDFQNGASMILFRMENPVLGEWRLEATLQTGTTSRIHIWISEQELNENTTLTPSESRMTVGAMAAINNVMSVGGYNKEDQVVLRSSGRGYSWDHRVAPLFITHSHNIIAPSKQNKWIRVSGTLPAASIMAGVIATFYSKFSEEDAFPFPNTLVMSNIILSHVYGFEGRVYPNPNEGYGVFDLQLLSGLLVAAYRP